MKIIVTSGGTSESIDDIRTITNKSTGRLGSLVADVFRNKDAEADISYVCSSNALLPSADDIEIIEVDDVDSLQQTLTSILMSQTVDVVVHAMAVSDYKPIGATTANDLASAITDMLLSINPAQIHDSSYMNEIILQTIIANNSIIDRGTKLKSSINHLMMSMGKTTKIIGTIKKLQPSTILIGFKLLNGVSENELIDTGHKLLVTNNCDFVLANDLMHINSGKHVGYFIHPDASYTKHNTKEDIANVIVSEVTRLAKQKAGLTL